MGFEEFGGRMREKWRERDDRAGGILVTFGVVEFEGSGEALRKERDDWRGTEMGGESWRWRRENWTAKERRLRRLGFGRLKGGKDGFRGGRRGGVRPG